MSKHRDIFDALHADIVTGKFKPDGRLPSEISLSRKWDVSRPTVARALRDLQNQGLIERRAGSGTFVRAEVRPIQPTIGLLVDGLGRTEILDPICAEITRAAQERGCGVFTGGFPVGKSPDDLAGEWAANRVQGILFAPLEHVDGNRQELNTGIVEAFRKRGLALVLVDRDCVEFPRRSDCDLVSMDNFHAGCELGEHIAAVGAKSVVFVARPQAPSTTDLRLCGLREGLRRSGLKAPAFLTGNPEDDAFMRKVFGGRSAFDTVVCSNDLTAACFQQRAAVLGLRKPKNLRLAGFDDAGFATLLPVPLTTMRQPCRNIGVACIDTMLGRLQHPDLAPRTILLRGELVIRESTGPARVTQR